MWRELCGLAIHGASRWLLQDSETGSFDDGSRAWEKASAGKKKWVPSNPQRKKILNKSEALVLLLHIHPNHSLQRKRVAVRDIRSHRHIRLGRRLLNIKNIWIENCWWHRHAFKMSWARKQTVWAHNVAKFYIMYSTKCILYNLLNHLPLFQSLSKYMLSFKLQSSIFKVPPGPQAKYCQETGMISSNHWKTSVQHPGVQQKGWL